MLRLILRLHKLWMLLIFVIVAIHLNFVMQLFQVPITISLFLAFGAGVFMMAKLPKWFIQYWREHCKVPRKFKDPLFGTLCYTMGTSEAFRQTGNRNTEPLERIIASAIRHPSGIIFTADAPRRHHHCIYAMAFCGVAGLRNTHDQGFMTNYGRYVDRHQAFKIAGRAEQIVQITGSPNSEQLFSEDLWIQTIPMHPDLEKTLSRWWYRINR